MASIERNKQSYNGSTMAASRGRFAGRYRSRGPSRDMARPRPRPRPESPALQQDTVRDIANQARIRNIEIERRARQIANQLIAQRERARLAARNGRIFTEFDLDTDVIPNQQEIVTRGLFPKKILL